jgi:hypothetical protein
VNWITSADTISASLARVAEWQTRRTQNPLSERACGFESHLGHSISGPVAVFYTKLRTRLLHPLLDAPDRPPAPIELRRALATVDGTLTTYIDQALGTAA